MPDSGDTLTVTSPARILRFLKQIHAEALNLRIDPLEGDGDRRYCTTILKIDRPAGRIILHQMLPADWRKRFQERMRAALSCKLSNGTIRFTGVISPIGDTDTISYCLLSLPHQVDHTQQRAFFRVPLPPGTVELTLAAGETRAGTIAGQAKDLSLGGVYCILEHPAENVSRGAALNCRLRIRGILDLSCPVEVCHASAADDVMRAGLRFVDLSPRQLETLRDTIVRLERRNIRMTKSAG